LGYTERVIAEVEGMAPGFFGAAIRPLIHHALANRGDAAGALARLFAFADTLDEPTVRDLLEDRLTDALLECGLIRREGAIHAEFQLRPFEELWLLADDATHGRDAVMPPAGTTAQVTRVLPPQLDQAVLDVGCGPGSLALVAAARGAPRVVGTDINERAIHLARVNARLNGLENAEFLVGDLFEPVLGERYPLILAQPPYVIQPPGSASVTFLHGGPSGEEIASRLFAGLAASMAPDGRALVLMEAIVRPEEPLHMRVRAALDSSSVDVLVLSAPGPPPVVQVLAYATLEAPDPGVEYVAAARRYLEHLDKLNAPDFHHALVVVRARAAAGEARGSVAATVPVGQISRGDYLALERLLACVDLAALDDPRLASQAVQAAEHTRWIEERVAPDDSLEPSRSVRFGVGSFGADLPLDDTRFELCRMLVHAPTIEQVVKEYAVRVRQTPDEVRTEVLGFVREALMRGLLEPRA